MNKSIKISFSLLSLSVLAIFTQSACASSDKQGWNPEGDAYFNEAERASRSGGDLSRYQQQMLGSNLEMYPEYWQLNKSLARQSPQTIIDFVKRYQGSVMAEKLVADYAEEKARTGDYASVRAVASYITNADASERCAIGLAFNQGNDGMRAYVEKNDVWLDTNKKQPALCQKLASEMNSNIMINNDDRSQRLYRMIRIGNNTEIVSLASRLGITLDYATLANIGNSPNQFLVNMPNLTATPDNRLLYLYALGKMAQKSVNEAALQFQYDLQRSPKFFDERTKRHAFRTLGVARMNVNTDIGFNEEAVNWMKNSLGEPFNFEEAEDYAQASIRFSRWADLENAIGAMDYKTQKEPIWQYWLAKAYTQIGNAHKKQVARQMFTTLAKKNDYYGLLSKDQLGQRYTQLPTAPHPTNNDYARLAQDANFKRAFSLYNMSADPKYTIREWNWAVKKAAERGDNAMILAAAQKANDMGWYDRAIFAVETTKALPNTAMAYPMPYKTAITSYSQRFGIDPAWTYGIIRQESRFKTDARSGVGAGGLMQVMPNTAKEVARKLGESYNASSANQADTNIRYGTFYLSDIFSQLNKSPALATAGYNAGASKARRWQPVVGSLPADQYVESIPYPETRGYVKAVMENTANYGVLLGESQSLSQRMGVIQSK